MNTTVHEQSEIRFFGCTLLCRNVFLFLAYYLGSNSGRSIKNPEKMVAKIGTLNSFLICIHNKSNQTVILSFWKTRLACGKPESYLFKTNLEKGLLAWLFVCNIDSKNIYI